LILKLDHGVDNMAMAISLVASTRGLALMPAYAKNRMANDGAGAYTYPNFAPYGINGGYYYGRVTIAF
jgi:hypothetical protein